VEGLAPSSVCPYHGRADVERRDQVGEDVVRWKVRGGVLKVGGYRLPGPDARLTRYYRDIDMGYRYGIWDIDMGYGIWDIDMGYRHGIWDIDMGYGISIWHIG